MNFVNRVQAKGLLTTAFKTRHEDQMMGFWRGDLPLRYKVKELHNDGALVLLALGLHNLKRMGGTHTHILAALNMWLPKLHMDQCPMYLEACYEIFTSKNIVLTSGKAADRSEINSVITAVLDCHILQEKEALVSLKKKVLQLHIVRQCHQLLSPFQDYTSFMFCSLSGEDLLEGSVRKITSEELGCMHERQVSAEECEFLDNIFSIDNMQEIDEVVIGRRGTVSITLGSLKTLRPKKWLNDEVIWFYLERICDEEHQFFPSFLMAQLLQVGHAESEGVYDYEAVSGYSKKVFRNKDIFSFKVLAIPINIDTIHWAVVIVFMKERCIQYYDSMDTRDNKGKPYVENAFQYLKDEHMCRHKCDLPEMKSWRREWNSPGNIPQQQNGFDCGVYCLSFIANVLYNIPTPTSEQEADVRRKQIALAILSK
jgi:sentrin-specific protease 1